MALLRSLSFNKGLSEDVLLLFKALVEGDNSKCDCCYEIIENALDGRIALDKEFNLRAYETTVKKNIRLSKCKQASNEISISAPITSDDDNLTIGDSLQDKSSFSEFDKVDDLSDYEWAIKYLSTSYNDFIIYDGIDVIICLQSALRGIPKATEEIIKLCNKYNDAKQAIKIILEHGIEEDLLNSIRR